MALAEMLLAVVLALRTWAILALRGTCGIQSTLRTMQASYHPWLRLRVMSSAVLARVAAAIGCLQ
jgi:hypothetical protein